MALAKSSKKALRSGTGDVDVPNVGALPQSSLLQPISQNAVWGHQPQKSGMLTTRPGG
jgi:hypothetical protein